MGKIKNLKASALVVTLMILGIVLLTGLSISLVSVNERKASLGAGDSGRAFQSAGSATEKLISAIQQLQQQQKQQANNPIYVKEIAIAGASCTGGDIVGPGYNIELEDKNDAQIDCSSNIPVGNVLNIKSVGTAGGDQRAIKTAVAFDVCTNYPTQIQCVDPNGNKIDCTSENSSDAMTLQQASEACQSLGGCWRLPTVDEATNFIGGNVVPIQKGLYFSPKADGTANWASAWLSGFIPDVSGGSSISNRASMDMRAGGIVPRTAGKYAQVFCVE